MPKNWASQLASENVTGEHIIDLRDGHVTVPKHHLLEFCGKTTYLEVEVNGGDFVIVKEWARDSRMVEVIVDGCEGELRSQIPVMGRPTLYMTTYMPCEQVKEYSDMHSKIAPYLFD